MTKQRAFLILTAALAISLSACVTPTTTGPKLDAAAIKAEADAQKDYAVTRRMEQIVRVNSIGYRLYKANAGYCGKASHVTVGMGYHSRLSYAPYLQGAAKRVFHTGERLSISYILDDSPGARAGLQIGDVILSVNGTAIPEKKPAREVMTRVFSRIKADDRIVYEIERDGVPKQIEVVAEATCGFPIEVVESDVVNAFADGRRMVVFTGFLRMVQNDNELALVMGHELAHNALGHIEAKMKNAAIGSLGGAVVDVLLMSAGVNTQGQFSSMGMDLGRNAFSPAFEAEADYVGLYFMARAGFDVHGMENVWRRMSADHPRGITLTSTHPPHAARSLSIIATTKEIDGKLAQGLPLTPEKFIAR